MVKNPPSNAGDVGLLWGLPWWPRGKESACQGRKRRFSPWVGKIPWRRAWQSTPVFLSEESLGQKILVGYSPLGSQESDTTEVTKHVVG